MKTVILTTMLLLTIILGLMPVQGQSYKSIFGKDSTQWNILEEQIDFSTTYIYKVGEDSMINGHSYKKCQIEGLFRIEYLREDTSTGEVWLLSSYDQKEYKVMSMNLNVSDSIYLYYASLKNDSFAVVDSIYFVNNRKHIRFHTIFFNWNPSDSFRLEFIEGIGTNAGMFFQTYYAKFRRSSVLLCATMDSLQIYSNTLYNGLCFVEKVGLNESQKNSVIEIFPNPFQNQTAVRFTSGIKIREYKIFDIQGRTVANVSNLNAYQLTIERGGLGSGIYMLGIKDEGGNLRCAKLLVD